MLQTLFFLIFIFHLRIGEARAITAENLEDFETSTLWTIYSHQWHNAAVKSHQTFFDLTRANVKAAYIPLSETLELRDSLTWVHSLKSLPETLNGEHYKGDKMITMMLDLEAFPPNKPSGNIHSVTSSPSQKDWIRVAALSTQNSEDRLNNFFSAIFKEKPNNFEFLVSYKNNNPVACAAVFYEESYASIYWIGVVPTERRTGLGRAITLAALNQIQRRNIRFVVLQAQPMGVSLYRSLGFLPCGELALY